MPNYGKRNDGTKKNIGYYGQLVDARGNAATEYSVGVELDGKEVEIPTLVPGLSSKELNIMLSDIIPNGKQPPRSIVDKAVRHARGRLSKGLSPFVESSVESTSSRLGIK